VRLAQIGAGSHFRLGSWQSRECILDRYEFKGALRFQVCEILRIFPDCNIDDDTNLLELGFDSLMFVELAVWIENTYDIKIALSDMYVYPSISLIAESILNKTNNKNDYKNNITT
jgi:acyl carrier protein